MLPFSLQACSVTYCFNVSGEIRSQGGKRRNRPPRRGEGTLHFPQRRQHPRRARWPRSKTPRRSPKKIETIFYHFALWHNQPYSHFQDGIPQIGFLKKPPKCVKHLMYLLSLHLWCWPLHECWLRKWGCKPRWNFAFIDNLRVNWVPRYLFFGGHKMWDPNRGCRYNRLK